MLPLQPTKLFYLAISAAPTQKGKNKTFNRDIEHTRHQ
jgi:hypothetical protein